MASVLVENVSELPRVLEAAIAMHAQKCIAQRNLFQILLNQFEIRLYLPFSAIDLEQQTDTVRSLLQINRGK